MRLKKLTRIKLVNWHYFVDVTINVNGSTLITGDNGTGKSTILDAMQYVLTGGKTRFNSAAHENARRSLLGYVRCKTGNDTEAYERKGDVTSHVAMEFYEEEKKKYFIIGSVIDSASDLSNPKEIFYRIENQRLDDGLFIKGSVPINISAFKSKMKAYDAKVHPTQNSAQLDYCNRFGSLNERFFQLITKALAFRPINNIKDFVYSYVLDQKEVNIEYLKENVRAYREFEMVLKDIKLRISKLDAIQEKYNDIARIQDNIKIHDYIILRSQSELAQSDLTTKRLDIESKERSARVLEESEARLSGEIQALSKLIDDLHTSMLNNQSYQLITNLENELKALKNEYTIYKIRNADFDKYLKEEMDKAQKLYKSELGIEGLDRFATSSKSLTDGDKVEEFAKVCVQLQDIYSKKHVEYISQRAKLLIEKEKCQEEITSIEKDIKILESKKLVYGENIVKLKGIIAEEIKKQTGKEEEPKILCELLHVQDKVWHDAVEGYLNTQRFDLIVDPEYFDMSLGAYEAYKKKNNIHSVGLVNTQKVLEYADCEVNSLAYVVTSASKYAKCYINQLLGRLVRCEKVEDLKKYQRSITPTCMTYQNNTARQINPEVYRKPYIGADAYKKQLDAKLKEKQVMLNKLKTLNAEIAKLDEYITLLGRPRFDYLRENCNIKLLFAKKGEEIAEKEEQLERIDRSAIVNMQAELEDSRRKRQSKEGEYDKVRRDILGVQYSLKVLQEDIQRLELVCEGLNVQLGYFEDQNVEIIPRASEKYEEELKTKALQAINTNFSRSRQGFDTQLNNFMVGLVKLQSEYNTTFHFGAAEGIDGIEDFQREYKSLKESKLIEYEEKINSARQKAEEQFKEHFIAKLQENIFSAQQEFKKLNSALKGIKFGEDEYEFKCSASKEYGKFYDMIMDNSNVESPSMFTDLFGSKHKEAMDELFERITIDDEQSQKALEKFTDYRTFMDYDIKIYHENGTTSTFSKVCREKSGGETQTPYYVAIAASFLHLYSNTLHRESIGLMLFDEAFDKMDDNRIESMMKFFKKLNLQVLLAAPPQKIESISPHVGTTLIVSREDKFSWAEALYINENEEL